MNAQQIKEALHNKQTNCSVIAEACDVSATQVSRVINRKTISFKVAKAICVALGKPMTVVFPDVDNYQQKPQHICRLSNEQVKNKAMQLKKRISATDLGTL